MVGKKRSTLKKIKPKKKLVVGNWKMNPQTAAEASRTFGKIRTTAGKLRKVNTVVCPPSVFLGDLRKGVMGKRLLLGGQDCHFEPDGSHTGEISALQLASVKAKYVIVGHSERRADGETDERIGGKVAAALKSGLSVIVCVGETARDKNGRYLKKIEDQLLRGLASVSQADFERVVIAYEPIWAIGKNALRPAHPRDVFEMKIFVRRVLSDAFGKNHSEKMLFLYGGSVDAKNARDFLADGEADGLLVGRASLDAGAFGEILKIAEEVGS